MCVGFSLVALVVNNVRPMGIDVTYIITGAVFSLVSAAALSVIIRRQLHTNGASSLKAFAFYAVLRLVAAVAVIAGYMMISGKRGKEMLAFAILFFAYFILQDAIDAIYLVRVQKHLQKTE